jgi:hypothetical protein
MQTFFVSLGLTRAIVTPVILSSFLVLVLFTLAFLGSQKARRMPPDYGLPIRGRLYFSIIVGSGAVIVLFSFILIQLPLR